MSQLMSMMGDIKRQIGIGIPGYTEDNHRRKEKEYVKAMTLRSSKVLSGPEKFTQGEPQKNTDNLNEEAPKVDGEPKLEEVVEAAIELEKEPIKKPGTT